MNWSYRLDAKKVRTALQGVFFCRVQPTLHATRRTPHGVSRLVHVMSAWFWHCRDARVYDHHALRLCMQLVPALFLYR